LAKGLSWKANKHYVYILKQLENICEFKKTEKEYFPE
jgi:hypothetical protein